MTPYSLLEDEEDKNASATFVYQRTSKNHWFQRIYTHVKSMFFSVINFLLPYSNFLWKLFIVVNFIIIVILIITITKLGKYNNLAIKSERNINEQLLQLFNRSSFNQGGNRNLNENNLPGLLGQLSANGKLTIAKVDRDEAQFCTGNELRKTFPDFDYATFGYNILYGFPLAQGHDPGLTHPIFKADYSDSDHTADCRYNVPKGYHLVPDVACVTSFSSQTIKKAKHLKNALSVSAEISGGGWGASFSASAGYKKTSSTMAKEKKVFVVSTAKCNYYVALMDEKNPPPFSKAFIKTVSKMKTTEDAIVFFKYYGTHYLTYVLFGARFVYQHKMSEKTYSSQQTETMSVSVKASYSGAFSIGGGFGMDSEHAKSAKDFLSKVETETISIGAPPPANGNTMVWASTVKDTPIPVQYKMESIEKLFTSDFFAGIGIDYQKKKELLLKAKQPYLQRLKKDGKLINVIKGAWRLDNNKTIHSIKKFLPNSLVFWLMQIDFI